MNRFVPLVLLVLVGCGKGGAPSQAQLEQLDFNMSEAEIESILGPGRIIDLPPPMVNNGPPPGMFPGMPTPPPMPVPQRRPGVVWKMWGNDDTHLCIAFSNGKNVGSQTRNLPGQIKRNGMTPDQEMAKSEAEWKKKREESDREFDRIREETDRRFEKDRLEFDQKAAESMRKIRLQSGYFGELSQLGFALRDYAEKNQTLTPPNVQPLTQGFPALDAELKQMITSGEIIIVWNAPKGSKVIAYPKIALESKGRYLDGNFNMQDSTPEKLKALLGQ